MQRESSEEIRLSETGYNKRDAQYYFDMFRLGENGEELIGKKVLDVGAGESNFADVVNSRYGKDTVSRIDPSFDDNTSNRSAGVFHGIANAIPLDDKSFDEVLASWSLYWVKSDLDSSLAEMLRVTKDGGRVKIRPVLFKQFVRDPLKLSELTSLHPFQEENGEYYYTVEIHKDEKASSERLVKEIETLTKYLDFAPGNKS